MVSYRARRDSGRVEPQAEPAGRLLIVEDSSVARRALEALFLLRGWSVAVVATVEEGLMMLDPPPDCVLLDLLLPDGGGELILRKVREEGFPTRVIVTTGCHDIERLRDVADLGPSALFHKPLDFYQVFDACRRIDGSAQPDDPQSSV